MKVLTSRERLDRCYRHRETDRPGLYLRGATEASPPHASYEPLRRLAVARGDLKKGWGLGGLAEPRDETCRVEPHSEDFERHVTILHTPAGDLSSSRLHGLKGQPGLEETYLLKSVKDAEKYLSIPLPEVKGDVSSFFDADGALGDRGIVEVGIGLNPAGIVASLFGSTQFAMFSVTAREVLHALLQREMERIIRILKYVLAQGVGPYFAMLGEEYVTPPLHGAKDFDDFNVRYDRPITDLIHDAGGLVHIHSHGPIKQVLPSFVALGADVLHPIEPPPMGNVTPKEAKAALRDKVCIEGNVQIGDIYTKSPDEVRAMVADLISDAFDDGKGLIVCPTASPYVPTMSEPCYENYATLVDTVTKS